MATATSRDHNRARAVSSVSMKGMTSGKVDSTTRKNTMMASPKSRPVRRGRDVGIALPASFWRSCSRPSSPMLAASGAGHFVGEQRTSFDGVFAAVQLFEQHVVAAFLRLGCHQVHDGVDQAPGQVAAQGRDQQRAHFLASVAWPR